MMNHFHSNPFRLAGVLLLSTLLFAPAAFAQHGPDHPGMGNMPGMHDGMHASGGKGMHDKGRHMAPHNAAAHFLQMADMLNLTDGQIASLRTLRDDWVTRHSVHEAQLAAAQSDLKSALHAPTVDKAGAEKALVTIGALEGQLWRAFVDQLAEIKGMLDKNQRARLGEMHRRHR